MKIMHIIPSLMKGGAEHLVLDVCRELQRQGHEVMLVTCQERNDYKYLSDEVNLKTLHLHVRPSVLGKWDVDTWQLNRVIGHFKPDVMHSHLFEAEMVSRYRLYMGLKYFTHCHDNMPQMRNFSIQTLFEKKRLTDYYEKRWLIKQYRDYGNKFIAISNDTKEYFEKVLPEDLNKNIYLLNNAIDFARFNAVNHPRETNTIRLVNIGSFVPKKNQQFLVDVMSELVKKRKADAKLVMLGDGPLLEDVKKKIRDNGLESCIECKGNVENVEEYLAEANMYIHSANYEPFGLVLLEAMASGLPVISLDGRGNRDIMNDYDKDFLIANPDPVEFADKILRVFNDGALYQRLSEESVRLAGKYEITEYTKKLLALYEEH